MDLLSKFSSKASTDVRDHMMTGKLALETSFINKDVAPAFYHDSSLGRSEKLKGQKKKIKSHVYATLGMAPWHRRWERMRNDWSAGPLIGQAICLGPYYLDQCAKGRSRLLQGPGSGWRAERVTGRRVGHQRTHPSNSLDEPGWCEREWLMTKP